MCRWLILRFVRWKRLWARLISKCQCCPRIFVTVTCETKCAVRRSFLSFVLQSDGSAKRFHTSDANPSKSYRSKLNGLHVVRTWLWYLCVASRPAGSKTKKLSQSDRKRLAQSSGVASSDAIQTPDEPGKTSNILTPIKENKTVPPENPWLVVLRAWAFAKSVTQMMFVKCVHIVSCVRKHVTWQIPSSYSESLKRFRLRISRLECNASIHQWD